MNAALFRCLACRPAAFLAVWGGQTERETPLADFKLHAARVRVIARQLADGRVFAAVSKQPLLQVGVVGTDMDKGVFLVKPNISGLFLLRKPCSHASSVLSVGMEKGQSISRLPLMGGLFSFTVCCSIIGVQFFKTCWWQTAF